ncbi:hypothetical protein GQ55_8G118300 [Panicum hallii var. hallii]|uniref:Uncharacterized protein n=1 Tax=Panicum hallii var. hallii TaxID=1504633 RepID=A0A2T7CMP4_9POAL|nr:hypothetical protein GQ55_8G118300 [Panicum hallii var. hallii]
MESDEEDEKIEEIVVDDVPIQCARHREEIVLSSSGATSSSSGSSSSSSSESSEEEDAPADDEAPPERVAPANKVLGGNNEAEGSLRLTDSDGYFESPKDPTAIIIGSLRFKSSDREQHGFLREAGIESGMANMLRCIEDLSLKAFVATRCANHQLQAEALPPLTCRSWRKKLLCWNEKSWSSRRPSKPSKASTPLRAPRLKPKLK